MAISYEQAVETLYGMFENWDKETIVDIFQSNNFHVERTIETILSMEQPSLDIQSQSSPVNGSTTRQ